jgi:hypothetical protein
MDVLKTAWYAERVLVPAEAFRSRDSAPPKIFRNCIFPYAEPSTFPISVPVFADIRPRSAAFMNISISVGVEEAFVASGRPMNVDIGSLNISVSY